MDEQPVKKKRTRKPKSTPKGVQRILQGRLNSLTGGQREMDAIEMLDHLRNVERMDDRRITGDLLLLMREKYQAGYRPPVSQSNTLTQEMQDALAMILDHIRMLSTLDLTALRSQPAWNEDHFQKTSSRLHESAADFLGQSKKYGDDDD